MAELDEPLSEREQEVLELLAQGTTNKEIAASLFISPNTVKVHLRNINTKLGARSRTEASRIALERGLVVIPGMEPVVPEVLQPSETDQIETAEPITKTEKAGPVENPSHDQVIETIQVTEADKISADSKLPRAYLFGGVVLLISLLAVIGWFVFNPRVIEPEPPEIFELTDLGERWFKSRPLPESLTAASAVSVGTDVFLIGGQQFDGTINDELHVYDSVAHTWQTVASKPEPVTSSAAVALDGLIFVIGGEMSDGEASDIVEVYSPSDDVWGTTAAMPHPISDGLAMTDGTQIYHLGGRNSGQTIADVYIFDPFDPTASGWQTLPSMPEARYGAVGGVVSGHLYVIGGANEAGDATADCFEFNLVEQTWSTCNPMGSKRVNAGGVVIRDNIYVIGGETGASFGERYNPKSNQWEKIDQPMVEDLDTPNWSDAGVTNIEAKVYVMGGEFNGTMLDDAYLYSPLVFPVYIPAASSSDE